MFGISANGSIIIAEAVIHSLQAHLHFCLIVDSPNSFRCKMARGLCIRNWHNCENWNINVTRQYGCYPCASSLALCIRARGYSLTSRNVFLFLCASRHHRLCGFQYCILHWASAHGQWTVTYKLFWITFHASWNTLTHSRRDANYFPLFFF